MKKATAPQMAGDGGSSPSSPPAEEEKEEPPHMEHPAKGAGKLRADLPLLDAVQTLVEKERALMELKVAEAADEAAAWKAKYALLAATSTHADELEDGEGARLAHTLPSAPAPHMLSHWELLKHPPDKVVARMLRQLRQVDLSREDLGGDELDFLARALPKVGARPHLSLAHNSIGDDGAKNLGKVLAVPLLSLDLSDNQMGAGCLVAVCAALSKQRDLQRLVLDGNPALAATPNAGDQLGMALCDQSRNLSKLHCLRVTLNDAAPSKWAPHPAAKHYKSATAAHRPPQNAHAFMKHMNKASSPKVAELALVGAALTKQTVTEIAHRLQDDSSGLTALDLSHASIGATGCKILEAGIRKATKMHGHSAKGGLVSLKLSHNKIGSAGVQCLVRVLVQARNASLLRLDVSSNEITDAGAGELAELVAQHPTLALLAVGDNRFGVRGTERLLASARAPKSPLLQLRGCETSGAAPITVTAIARAQNALRVRRSAATCGAAVITLDEEVSYEPTTTGGSGTGGRGGGVCQFIPIHAFTAPPLPTDTKTNERSGARRSARGRAAGRRPRRA